jgi:prepilin-type processing-associated H-X9-DG protein
MDIEYKDYEDGTLDSITINGDSFDYEGESISIPKSHLNDFPTKELRNNVRIEVCDHITEGVIHVSSIPYSIERIADKVILISFDDLGRRKYWDAEIGYKLYMETKKTVIAERQKEIGDIFFDDYDDDGDYIHLTFHTEIEAEIIGNAIQIAEQIIKEIEGAVDLTLGSPFKKIEDINDEADFTISVLIPLLRKLGFSDVRYNHGKKEFGKDIIFSRRTEFDEYEYWGVQVKHGNISGGANSLIDVIIKQAEDAFRMPFYDVYTREKRRISKLLIVTSGKFTENAVEKICDGIERHSLKNNMLFVDGDKIDSLSERFRRR